MVQLVIMLLGSVHVNLDTLEQLVTAVRNSILITMLLLMISGLQTQLWHAVSSIKRLSLIFFRPISLALFFCSFTTCVPKDWSVLPDFADFGSVLAVFFIILVCHLQYVQLVLMDKTVL